MHRRLFIYIAGPYSASTPERVESNVQHAIDAGIAVYRRGHLPYIPHLTHLVELRSQQMGAGLTYEDYMKMDWHWLGKCNGFLYLGSSPGADRELSYATVRKDMRVFRSIDDIPFVSLS